jgi:hypothetical protein
MIEQSPGANAKRRAIIARKTLCARRGILTGSGGHRKLGACTGRHWNALVSHSIHNHI